MRVELALIVGIVFFCCWCAYIIVKMNSSVSNPPNSPLAQRDMSSPNADADLAYLANAYNFSISDLNHRHTNTDKYNQQARNYPPTSHYMSNLYQAHAMQLGRQPDANSPVATYSRPTSGGGQTPVRPATRWRPALIGEHYLAGVGSSPRANSNGNSEEEQESEVNSGLDAPPTDPIDGDSQGSDWQQGPSSEPDVADQPEQPDQPDQPDQTSSDYNSESQQEEPEANELPASGQQLEERADKRSYDQLIAESNERDRAGRPIRAHRRHLVNGRPVAPKQGSADDFERVVDEIDQANKNRRDQQQNSSADYDESPAETANSTSTFTDPEQDTGEEPEEDTTPKSSVDEHKHQMVESLKAQQWDDDSAGPSQPVTNNATASTLLKRSNVEQDFNHETTTPLPESPMDFKDLDLFAESDKLSAIDQSPRSRQRRQALDFNSLSPLSALTDNSSANISVHLVPPSFSDLAQPTIQPQVISVSPMSEPSAPGFTGASNFSSTTDIFPQVLGVEPLVQTNSSPWYASEDQLAKADQQFYGPQISQASYYRGQPEALASKSKSKKMKSIKSKRKKSSSAHKYKAAKAHSMKRKKQSQKGELAKRRKKAKKKMANGHKEFKGSSKGSKMSKGGGQKGAKKGVLFYKDKGYKKRGFKRAYQKLESGDHKTYFDEFRDKDHKKKWKNYKDKHNYSHSKKWAGKDKKRYNHHNLSEMKNKKSKSDIWSEKKASKMKKGMKYVNDDEYESIRKKKKKKKKKKQSSKDYD